MPDSDIRIVVRADAYQDAHKGQGLVTSVSVLKDGGEIVCSEGLTLEFCFLDVIKKLAEGYQAG
jgi:hypothetical protein